MLPFPVFFPELSILNLMSNQAISRRFNSFSILTEILEILLVACFPLFEKTCHDFASEIFYLERSVRFSFEPRVDICILNLVWKCCLDVSGRETPGGKGEMLSTPPFATICPVPGEEAISPQEDAFPRLPLAESGIGGNSYAGDARGLRMGRAWHGRGTEGGRGSHGRAGADRGVLEPAYFQRSILTST